MGIDIMYINKSLDYRKVILVWDMEVWNRFWIVWSIWKVKEEGRNLVGKYYELICEG